MRSKCFVSFFVFLIAVVVPVLARTGKPAEPSVRVASLSEELAHLATTSASVATGETQLATSPIFLDLSVISSEAFVIKKDSFEEAGKELSKKADRMEKKLVPYFGRLVAEEIVPGISIGKAGLALLLLMLMFLLNQAVVYSLRQRLGETWPRQFDLDAFSQESSQWLNPFLAAVYRPLFLCFGVYGLFTILTFVFGNRELEGWIVQTVVGQIAEITGFFSFFWAMVRVIRIIDIRLRKWAETTPSNWDNLLVPFVGRILKVVIPLLAFVFSLPFFHFSLAVQSAIEKLLAIVLILFFSWILARIVLLVEKGLLMEFGDKVAADLRARRIYTQAHVLKKVFLFTISLLSLSSVLMIFESVRQLGAGILASAGVLGIIVGFAAQRTISTVLAGIQIVMTQPIRLEDVVIVEGEWGKVEEISLTYVVIRIWDLRRLVVPISYFLEKPFQNWTRTSNKILGTVFLYLDYTVPVEQLRQELKSAVGKSPLWDGDVCGLQVTDAKEQTMEVRALVSSEDSSKSWDLRCEIREHLISFLQKTYPEALPRMRVEMGSFASDAVGEPSQKGRSPS